MVQNANETVEQFVMRLREEADLCNFGTRLDDDIRDQVIDGRTSRSKDIQIKILEDVRCLTVTMAHDIIGNSPSAMKKLASKCANWGSLKCSCCVAEG